MGGKGPGLSIGGRWPKKGWEPLLYRVRNKQCPHWDLTVSRSHFIAHTVLNVCQFFFSFFFFISELVGFGWGMCLHLLPCVPDCLQTWFGWSDHNPSPVFWLYSSLYFYLVECYMTAILSFWDFEAFVQRFSGFGAFSVCKCSELWKEFCEPLEVLHTISIFFKKSDKLHISSVCMLALNLGSPLPVWRFFHIVHILFFSLNLSTCK